MKYTPGLFLMLGGLAMWLGLYGLSQGDIAGGAVMLSLGLLFVVEGIALDRKFKRYGPIGGDKNGPAKLAITNPKVDGFAIGVNAARSLIEAERRKAELEAKKAKAKRDFVRLPNGKEAVIHLFYNEEFDVWVVSVPEGPSILDEEYYHFDDYGRALEFYESVKAGMEAFRGGGDGSGEGTA